MVAYEGMLAETVQFTGNDGDLISGYLARPLGAGPFPGVVVIHEVFGLVPHILEVTRKFANAGYAALGIDLHHREGPGDPDDVAAIVRAAGGVPDSRAVGDVEGAARYLRSLPYLNGKVGIIGYCSGGRQTYVAASSIESLDAAVVCYGGRIVAAPKDLTARQPVAPIDMTSGIHCPMLGLFGAEDRSPTMEQVKMIEQELQRHDKTFEFHMYPDAGHAFFADYRPSYRQSAALDGWEKIFRWFGKYLKANA